MDFHDFGSWALGSESDSGLAVGETRGEVERREEA